jgi:hypothetical protein
MLKHRSKLIYAVQLVFAVCALWLGSGIAAGAAGGLTLAMALAPFPINPFYTSIAIAYRNARMIADQVLPRVPVGKQDFRYLKHTLAESFTLPDVKVGRKSQPNRIDFSATEVPDVTLDYALDDAVPQVDIDNAPPNYDPLGRAVEGITDLIMLHREKRTADLVFTLNNYPAANRTTLSGNNQWSDFVNSNPINDILAGLDTVIVRPNVMVIGQAVWTKLSQHPKIVQAVYGTAQNAGIVRREAVADLFELEELLVGQGWVNTAKKGQAATLVRVWGKHCLLFNRNNLADTNRGVTFGYTAQFGERVAGAFEDKNIGMRGGQIVRAGESVKELIAANDLAYFIQNAIA